MVRLTVTRSFGGKGTMLKHILPLLPKSKLFMEPYGGSGAVLFSREPSEIEIFNDLNSNIVALMTVLQKPELFSIFQNRVSSTYYSREASNNAKDKLKTSNLSILDRAFYFFYVNRTRRSGGEGGFQVSTVVRRGMAKNISDWLSVVDRLPEFHERIQNVTFENTDAITLIQRYDRPGSVYYLDPPYHWSTRTEARYAVDMDDAQQEYLVDVLLEIKHAKILLSGYDNSEYERLPWTKEQFNVKTVTGTNQRKDKTETLWRNYD